MAAEPSTTKAATRRAKPAVVPSKRAGRTAGSKATAKRARPAPSAPRPTLTISSRNYSSWSLRGWLLARFAGMDFDAVMVSPDDEDARKELLLLAPSIRVPCLEHDGARVWNTLGIAQYLDEWRPSAGLLPTERIARAHCRSISGEMNSGFANLRSALPMNLKARHPGFKVWAGAQPDIDRVCEIWNECLIRYGGPYLFGARRTMADAMYAPVVTRFLTYDVSLDAACAGYCTTIMEMPEMQEWIAAARCEPEAITELEMDF